MDASNSDASIFVSRCKCCLSEGDLRNLWVPYPFEGEAEIYGLMLSECFTLPCVQPEEYLQYMEKICYPCIIRLRQALAFRREVLVSEEVLREHQDKMFSFAKPKEEFESEQENETEFQDVEYLDVYHDAVNKLEDDFIIDDLQSLDMKIKHGKPKQKWPKKLPKEERNKTYKQYSIRDLKMAINAVLSNKMTITVASKEYGVPRKTLSAKFQYCGDNVKEIDEDERKLVEQEKNFKLLEEIKIILTYTNAIPYKTKTSRYYCAYCSTDGPTFEDPDDLRTHTRTQHIDERTKDIVQIMKPPWLNEVLKLDIHSLHCTVCCTILPTWSDMFKHLEMVHQIVLDEAYNRVIPYILTRELSCALCGDAFSNYHNLDGHMNAHYSSYICYECGDTFLAASRLNKHIEVHKFGEYPCEACGKVFKLKKYTKKHYDLVHSSEQKIRCLYCSEKFYGIFQRHQHVLKAHSERIKIMACEICGKTFDWQPYYSAHMRRIHGTVKNHKCSDCGKTFLMRYELKNHRAKHETHKNFICDVCSERFKSKPGLMRHYRVNHDPEPRDQVGLNNNIISEA